ncbi:MAG: fused MFS/spermidine synthase, partial [Anaerolineae bacterium]|nr:fused MFS/spermidine synthase [Anaerolineae bacterium]
WFWQPTLVVFVANACIMILELVAGRIIAPQVGVSLYTWTSVIGVILAGMSLGNYLGGWLADRYASLKLLGTVFLASGVASLAILGIDQLHIVDLVTWPIVAEILLMIFALFFLPAAILGTISPIVVKLAMDDLQRAGRTVGRISAFGTAGSILGTFATGFWLIAWFGTYTVVWGVAVVLLCLGALFLLSGKLTPTAFAVVALVGIAYGTVRLGWTRSRCLRETSYFCITVRETQQEGKTLRRLILDRLVHSYSSLEDPTELQYGYERTYAELVAYQAGRHADLRTFFIGGGGYTFPRYMAAVYPGSTVDVAEIDPGVTEVAYEYLGLSRDGTVNTYTGDARVFLEAPVAETYDIIFGDAFNDFSVPYHLTTVGFNERVRVWLAEDGLYVVNIIDGALRRFLPAYVRTLYETFDHVYIVPNAEGWRTVSRDTFVIVATDRPIDVADFEEDSRFRRSALSEAEIAELLAEGRQIILTDRYAPVEQMLAPVYLGRVN